MTLTLDQLRKLAELNMDKKHYDIYCHMIEPNIKSMLKDYLKGWQDLETLVTRIVLRVKGAYKGNTELMISDGDDPRKYGKYLEISVYNKVKKMNFGQKITFLHKKGVIGDSMHQLLDFLRKRRNKIQVSKNIFLQRWIICCNRPYHNEKKAFVCKVVIDYTKDEYFAIDQNDMIETAILEDDKRILKTSHHPTGSLQFSGDGIRSGTNEDGTYKGIGIQSWTFKNPAPGPSFSVTIKNYRNMKKSTKNNMLLDRKNSEIIMDS